MVTVRSPASSANLGSGYDTLAIALERPADVVTAERTDTTSIEVEGPEAEGVPESVEANTAGAVARALDVEAAIRIHKGIPPGSGLGSSGASAAGAAVALDRLYDLGLTMDALVEVASQGEAVVAGSPHADNVAAAISGGFTVVTDAGITALPTAVPVVVCVPDLTVSTRRAREVVPGSIATEDHVDAIGRVGTVVIGMCRSDPAVVGRGLAESALTAQRKSLIPAYETVVEWSRRAGATGVAVSGAGPSILAVCEAGDRSDVGKAMVEGFATAEIEAVAIETAIGDGTTVLDRAD